MRVGVGTCTQTHTHIHIHTHAREHTPTHTYLHFTHTLPHTHTHMYIQIQRHTHVEGGHVHIHTRSALMSQRGGCVKISLCATHLKVNAYALPGGVVVEKEGKPYHKTTNFCKESFEPHLRNTIMFIAHRRACASVKGVRSHVLVAAYLLRHGLLVCVVCSH